MTSSDQTLKKKFEKMYLGKKSPWRFDIHDSIYLSKKNILKSAMKKSKVILDLGCAEGNFLESLLDGDARYIVGVDIAENAIELAREKEIYDELFATYIDDIEMYSKNLSVIDMILLNEVLYYVENYVEVLDKILTLSARYVFLSLAMGSHYFSLRETQDIEEICQKHDYKIVEKNVVDMKYRGLIPMRYLRFIYTALGRELNQTHKTIYLFEKRKETVNR